MGHNFGCFLVALGGPHTDAKEENYEDVHTLTQKRGNARDQNPQVRVDRRRKTLQSWIKVCLMTKAQRGRGVPLDGTRLSLFGPQNVKQALARSHSLT